jgi:hypothetical protein
LCHRSVLAAVAFSFSIVYAFRYVLFAKKMTQGGVMTEHLLFFCASGSSRALMAASLLCTYTTRWQVWSTPPQDERERSTAEAVLQEMGIVPISSDRFILPTFQMRWDEGIVLCSRASDT